MRLNRSVTAWNRFWIGGLGALLPLLVTLMAIDVGAIWDHRSAISTGLLLGTAFRYLVLFSLGGIVAALNSDEVKPIKLVQLGIAAPAIITSFINAQSPQVAKLAYHPQNSLGLVDALIHPAMAASDAPAPAASRTASSESIGFFNDFVAGATTNLGHAVQQQRIDQEVLQQQRKQQEQRQQIERLERQLRQLQHQ